MKIVVVGLGYVGVTAAACLASQGHTITGVDVNPEKVALFARGISPILEPGVEALLADAHQAGLLFASETIPPLGGQDIVLVCVGTPSAADGSHNMDYVAASSRQIAEAIDPSEESSVTVVFRSTFKPGTMDELIVPIFGDVLGTDLATQVELIYNPEFLRESTAVSDYFQPPKIVVGSADGMPSRRMEQMYAGINAPTFVVGFREAEITKFVDNSWHAVKVAFANEVGRVCAAYDVDPSVMHQVFVSDTKLNISAYYTLPGGPFGGSCLPKDVRAMEYIAGAADVRTPLMNSLIPSNEDHKDFQLARVTSKVVSGSRILVVGLAFKPDTDDMRESPHVQLVTHLTELGYKVRVLDPAVQRSSLTGQNLAQILQQIPTLETLLIDESSISLDEYDLVVLNHTPPPSLALQQTRTLDLRKVA